MPLQSNSNIIIELQYLKYGNIILFSFLLLASSTSAQQDSLDQFRGDFGGLFELDSIVVRASRTGFDLEDFVDMVQKDTSFYKSFRQLRFTNYQSIHNLNMFDKKGKSKAFYNSNLQQNINGLCREIKFVQEDYSSNFFKKKRKHRFYTGKLLDVLFQTSGCESQYASSVEANEASSQSSRTGRHIQELKKLIFQPGQKANVPMIGGKTAIFEKKMAPYYNFSITSKIYKGTIDCYVFKAELRPEYQTKKQDKTVVKFLETYFNKSDFAIVARNYHLAYYGALYDFDVKMEIECKSFGESFLPARINYDGFWDIPGRKPEIGKFSIVIENPKASY